MADVLARSLDAGAPAPRVRTHYVRYQPGKSMVVHYDVDLDGRSHGAVAMIARGDELSRWVLEPRNRAMAVQVNGRSPAAMPLAYEQRGRRPRSSGSRSTSRCRRWPNGPPSCAVICAPPGSTCRRRAGKASSSTTGRGGVRS